MREWIVNECFEKKKQQKKTFRRTCVKAFEYMQSHLGGVWWGSLGKGSDLESRGPGLDLHRRHRVVSLSKTH